MENSLSPSISSRVIRSI